MTLDDLATEKDKNAGAKKPTMKKAKKRVSVITDSLKDVLYGEKMLTMEKQKSIRGDEQKERAMQKSFRFGQGLSLPSHMRVNIRSSIKKLVA
mmetsp:Transcript_80375/g.146965  ORF Transcript_80375/g.146965 Transcript_80375/m.146965 type:complete len:93 (-) Transcript_80375:89-367(-)